MTATVDWEDGRMSSFGESQTLRPAVLNDRFQQDRTFAPSAVIG
jgi:hypothetical protein